MHAKLIQSCLTLFSPVDCSLPGSCLWDSPGKNTRVGCQHLLKGVFPRTEPTSLVSPTLAGEFFTTSAAWEYCSAFKKKEIV